MTPTIRPAQAATQLAQLLDQPPSHPTQHLAARLTNLAHLLWTAGHIATTRAHEQAPGIRATNLDGRRSPGPGDPTLNAVLAKLTTTGDDTPDLEHQLRAALVDLDHAARRLTNLVDRATTTTTITTDNSHQCSEALCETDAAPGRLGYCETDYRRRLRWAEQHLDLTPPDWDTAAKETPRQITKAERLGIHQAPALTHAQLADRAIRKRRTPA